MSCNVAYRFRERFLHARRPLKLVEKPDPHPASLRPIFTRLTTDTALTYLDIKMPGEPAKRTRREEYKKSLQNEEQNAALPKKKFYRQRAHANPFSDHSLT